MKDKIRSIGFSLILFSISIGNILTPIKSFSAKENRYLQGLPKITYKSIMANKFSQEFETYTTDQFILRDFWISAKTMSDLAILKKDNGRVIFAKDSYLFDKGQELDEKQAEKNIENIASFLKRIGQGKDLDINLLLVPNKAGPLRDKLPSYAPVLDEKILVERIKGQLNPSLKVWDLSLPLEERSHEYIYYKTDHHWTSQGAYYAYKHFLEGRGERPLEEEDFLVREVSKDFLGTAYRKANLYFGQEDSIHRYEPKKQIDYSILVNNQFEIDSIYDGSYLDKTDKYSYFFGGDKALVEIKSSLENGKKILVFKDSFANSFLPFLMNHYEELIIIDSRYFNMDLMAYLDEKDFNEILFLYNTENFLQEKSFSIFRDKEER